MVFDKISNRERAYGTLVVIGILAFIFWKMSDSFSNWAATTNPWVAMIASILLNPVYLFLIYVLWKEYKGRGLIAGLLVSLSLDIISMGHSIDIGGLLPANSSLYTYADTTLYKIIYPLINGQTGTFVLYVLLPLALVYIALRVVRRNSSFNKIFKEAI